MIDSQIGCTTIASSRYYHVARNRCLRLLATIRCSTTALPLLQPQRTLAGCAIPAATPVRALPTAKMSRAVLILISLQHRWRIDRLPRHQLHLHLPRLGLLIRLLLRVTCCALQSRVNNNAVNVEGAGT